MDLSFLIVSILAGIVLIVIGSMSLYEGVRDHSKKTSVNHGLVVMGTVTIIVAAIMYFYVPVYAKKEGTSLVTLYMAEVLALAGFSLGVIGMVGATEINKKPKLDTALKTVGGVTTAAGIAGVIVGSFFLYTKLKGVS